jgi:hypothetical protein
MKKRTWSSFVIVFVVTIIVFSLVQLRMPVVCAANCPSSDAVSQSTGCNCTFVAAATEWTPQGLKTECYYSCWCYSGNNGEHFEIERTETIYEP